MLKLREERILFRDRAAIGRWNDLRQTSGDACLTGTMLPQVFLNKINFPEEIRDCGRFFPFVRENPTQTI